MPLPSWKDDWTKRWRVLWEILWYDLKGWIKYTFWWSKTLRDAYWGYLKDDLESIATHVTDACEHYALEVTGPIEDWVLGLLGLDAEPTTKVYDAISGINDSITALWARFGYDITNTTKTVVDWVRDEIKDALKDFDPGIGGINDSIVALWAKFGYDITNTTLTVVQWVQQEYDAAKDQADAAATWIATTGAPAAHWVSGWGVVTADWVVDNGRNLLVWYNTYSTYYADLYDLYHNVLLTFLQDPGAFIAGYVEDYLEGTEEKPGPSWWKALLAFLLNPVAWLLGLGALFWGTLATWIIEWLEENFPSLDEAIASIVPPDRGLPTVEEWLQGLLKPKTDEQKAYMELMDLKLQHIMDDILPDKPLTATEFASLISPEPGRTET